MSTAEIHPNFVAELQYSSLSLKTQQVIAYMAMLAVEKNKISFWISSSVDDIAMVLLQCLK